MIPSPRARTCRRPILPIWPAFLVIWALLSAKGMAQEGIRVGPAIGYEFGVPLMADRTPGVVNRFGAPSSGYSYNHGIWLGAELQAPGLFADWIGPTARFSIGYSTGRFISDTFTVGRTIDPTNDTLGIPVVEELELYSTLGFAQLDLPVAFRLGRVTAGLGPWFSLRLSSGYLQTLRIVSPDSILLAGTPNEWIAGGGSSLGGSPFRWGGLLSLSLPVALNDRTALEPMLFTRLDARALADGLGVRSFSIGAGFGVAIDPSADRAAPPPPNESDLPQHRDRSSPALDASVHLTSDDGSRVAMVRPVRTRHEHVMPMLPAIFFDEGSSDIPARYVRLAPKEAEGFTRNALVQLEPEGLYRQILNVIGMRMRSESDATITLNGSAAPDERAELARSRAERVRAYLEEVWGIARGRITIGASGIRSGSAAERRAVTIASASPAILAPIATEWIVRGWRAPQVRLGRSIKSDAGVKNWKITVRQGSEVIGRYSSEENDPLGDLGGVFQVPRDDARLDPLIAELVVEDAEGRTAVAHDTLVVERGSIEPNAPVSNEVLLYTFLDDGANDPLLRTLGDAIVDGAEISIADLPGGSARRWSAAGTAGRLLEAIGPSKRPGQVRIGGVAESKESDDGTPEHALVNTGSRVRVEQEKR